MALSSDRPPPAPSVVLVHGAGLDGTTFAPLAAELRGRGVGVAVLCRRGYDSRPASADLELHLADLAAAVGAGPAVVVGVSGGATLALALALRNLPSVVQVVAHEPLLGPLAPAQHEVVVGSIRTMLADDEPGAVGRFLRRLVTPQVWAAIGPVQRAAAERHAATVRTEAAGFASFEVSAAELERRTTPLLLTVGQRSPAWRHQAAAAAAAAGAAVRPLPGAHTPQLEHPGPFADLIEEVVAP